MGTINQRLKSYFREMELVQERIAEDLGATKQQMSNWLSDTKIPLETLTRIFLMFKNLNARWIFTGEGSMLMEANETPYVTTELKRNSNEPQPPYHTECKNPLCKLRIESLEREIQLLEANISDLRRKENCGQGELKGGVEKRGKAG